MFFISMLDFFSAFFPPCILGGKIHIIMLLCDGPTKGEVMKSNSFPGRRGHIPRREFKTSDISAQNWIGDKKKRIRIKLTFWFLCSSIQVFCQIIKEYIHCVFIYIKTHQISLGLPVRYSSCFLKIQAQYIIIGFFIETCQVFSFQEFLSCI